jgi:hypothetical protein
MTDRGGAPTGYFKAVGLLAPWDHLDGFFFFDDSSIESVAKAYERASSFVADVGGDRFGVRLRVFGRPRIGGPWSGVPEIGDTDFARS